MKLTKQQWIILAIVIVVVVGILAMIKFIPFWGTILSLVSYVAGIASYWLVKKYSPLNNK